MNNPITHRLFLVFGHRYGAFRVAVILSIQLMAVVASYLISFLLRLDDRLFDLNVSAIPWSLVAETLPFVVVVRMGALVGFRAHRQLWSYSGVGDLVQIVKATTVSSLAFVLLMVLTFGFQGFPRSVIALDWLGNVGLLAGAMLLFRIIREGFQKREGRKSGLKRLLIVGAGDAGVGLCKQVLGDPGSGFTPVCLCRRRCA